jgi:hypothetical protein
MDQGRCQLTADPLAGGEPVGRPGDELRQLQAVHQLGSPGPPPALPQAVGPGQDPERFIERQVLPQL